MARNSATLTQSPNLLIKELADLYIRTNFQNLADYFRKQNQLLNFEFFEVVFTAAGEKLVSHGLGSAPRDLIRCSVVGAGAVILKRADFNSRTMRVIATGPVVVRFFAGSYWKDVGTQPNGDEVWAPDLAQAAQSLPWRDVVFLTRENSPYSIDPITGSGKIYSVDSSGGAVVVRLPLRAQVSNPFSLAVKKSAGSNSVTVVPQGTNTIEGATSLVLPSAGSAYWFVPSTTRPGEWTTLAFGAGGGGGGAGNMIDDQFTGNGVTTSYALTADPGSEANCWVSVEGVFQDPSAYSLSGATLTFVSAPPNGTDILIKYGSTLAIGVPANGSVNTDQLSASFANGLSVVTPTTSDHVVIADASAGGDAKKVTVAALLALGGEAIFARATHGNDSSFARTNTALGEPAVDATSTFTVIESNGLTVSSRLSGSDKLPGIVINSTVSCKLRVSAAVGFAIATSGQEGTLDLYDGTNSFKGAVKRAAVATDRDQREVSAIITVVAGVDYNLYFRTAATSGAITIASQGSSFPAIYWDIWRIGS